MEIQYTQELQRVIKRAKRMAKKEQAGRVGSIHLFMAILEDDDNTASVILNSVGVTLEVVKSLREKSGMKLEAEEDAGQGKQNTVLQETITYQKVMEACEREGIRCRRDKVGTAQLLMALLEQKQSPAVMLMRMLKIDIEQLFMNIQLDLGYTRQEFKGYNTDENRNGGSRKEKLVQRYGRDLVKIAANQGLDPVVGREEEIKRLIQILCRRSKNNPCLLGEPGVGKTAIVEGLAAMIAQGQVPEVLRDKQLMSIDMASLVAGTKYRGEFEERMKHLIQEVEEDDSIILFMDEIHTLIGAGGAEGALDASNILKPALARGSVRMIGATTTAEYRKHIEKDAALERRFQPVAVAEPTKEEAVAILEGIKHCYEEFHGVSIEAEAVEAAVALSVRYVHDRYLPDKAIDLIDEACARKYLSENYKKDNTREQRDALEAALEEAICQGDLQEAKKLKEEIALLETKKKGKGSRHKASKVVTAQDVTQIMSNWTKIPLTQLEEKESARLMRLDKELHKRVIGQQEAIDSLAKAIRRGRVGLKSPNRPIGSFLFLGPTGVGKTELSKALAEAMFGDEKALIRVDMSELMEKHSVSKLIGAPPGYVGYEEGGQFSEKVRKNPYSVILLDEIEKADPDIFNLLLQILDDGQVTDAQGRYIDFRNTVIIMTSNVGANRIMEPKLLGFGSKTDVKAEHERMKNSVMEELRRMFRPEFLNRIDDILVFQALQQEEIKSIVSLLMNQFAKRVKEQMGITLQYDVRLCNLIYDKYYDAKYGARPLRRGVQNLVEDALAEAVLEGRVKTGDQVRITIRKDQVHFQVK